LPQTVLKGLPIIEKHPGCSSSDELFNFGRVGKDEFLEAHMDIFRVAKAYPPSMTPLELHIETLG
jgi:hypothetical protein